MEENDRSIKYFGPSTGVAGISIIIHPINRLGFAVVFEDVEILCESIKYIVSLLLGVKTQHICITIIIVIKCEKEMNYISNIRTNTSNISVKGLMFPNGFISCRHDKFKECSLM